MPYDLTLRSERLLLRPWCQDDYPEFASMSADADVMAHFPALMTAAQSTAVAERFSGELLERGWGIWALERLQDKKFIGFTGLNPFSDLPIVDGVEIVWRLTRGAWGQGYASEAAQRALRFAFEKLSLMAIDSFTATSNTRSIAVMQRLGMSDTGQTFLHPRVPEDSPLRKHVLYRITREQWQATAGAEKKPD